MDRDSKGRNFNARETLVVGCNQQNVHNKAYHRHDIPLGSSGIKKKFGKRRKIVFL